MTRIESDKVKQKDCQTHFKPFAENTHMTHIENNSFICHICNTILLNRVITFEQLKSIVTTATPSPYANIERLHPNAQQGMTETITNRT